MNPVVTAVVVGAITTLGRWSRGKGMTIDIVVGVLGVAIFLALLDQINREFAKAFSTLVVVGVTVAHAPTIFEKVGLTSSGGKAVGRVAKE